MTGIADQAWFRDPALGRILALLNDDGGEGRVVGGAVRNSLMGLPVSDIDIATTLTPEIVMERAAVAGVKAVPTGLQHGTVTLVVDGKPFEVTTLRTDVETDGRRAKVAFSTDWKADAERRDLTINALYADANGEVVDLVGGLADIETRNIRFIGDAARRIAEDHLRILRFFRFFAYYGSGRPDAEGLKACAAARAKLKTLSAERVWSELRKLLGAADPGRALLWMRQVAVLTEILPESERWGIDAIPSLVATEKALGWAPDPLLRLAAIVPPDPVRLGALAARLKLSNAEAATLKAWAMTAPVNDELSPAAFERLLYRNGPDGIVTRLKLALGVARGKAEVDLGEMARSARLGKLLDQATTWKKPQFPVNGGDVIAAGIASGPRVGELLAVLENLWVEENFASDRATLLARLQEHTR
ncbi:CCA tRNA nucleotidyltransferase [Rhizobium bangladeshense]|uniref:CCA tRNA nucleotidyltransferase n=1 Tax=Rhizobium bangladeshense TaxID=1138189 RepID=A0ABS7LCX9_9HYPH|nr:CCA tRNA nucleotidyltransferase [Rhizobium bangladeshense]MBX4866642.1 CCA tRNA nucleotidyltransferase [Rhizobium bangladeshense]MBX4873395.1 CCA tRNA nucleotidyltransferase [Rhizobium bangladeshense]MBX4883357.1 CCA tRNA nucleotidyltransferase [Rhizobium bangladeshense]MBY3588638.1 CCA tRNA nucleotidyltransferase [Rhizobium bangladeshense]QSY93390.1 CCA tRNA nucleotidyltransferase [Rhizobium bangladeshense]